jgi:hypothetical protein
VLPQIEKSTHKSTNLCNVMARLIETQKDHTYYDHAMSNRLLFSSKINHSNPNNHYHIGGIDFQSGELLLLLSIIAGTTAITPIATTSATTATATTSSIGGVRRVNNVHGFKSIHFMCV